MTIILNKINPEEINYYIEKNLDDLYTKSSEHPNFISSREDKISWVLSKKANWPDCIFRANFENLDIKKEITNIEKLIRKGKIPNGWTVGPLTRPKDLGNLLEKYGFSNVYQQAGMAVELKNIENIDITENELIVELVNNEDSLAQWSNIASNVFSLRMDFEFLKFLFRLERFFFYLGKFKEEFVSALLLYMSSGVVGLHAVATLSNYRNKGFGLTISRKALLDAFKKGYKVGVLQASSLGEKIYRKLGFQKYCDIISYSLIDVKKR
ncbi:MAG: GNAT family N-acetyltransferase [Promethearchaeota archaeon]